MALEQFTRGIERLIKDERKYGVDNDCQTEADVAIRRYDIQCLMFWSWDADDKSIEASLGGLNNTVVTFHPQWSNGTAGIRASQPVVAYGLSYWEIQVGHRVFGTSLMFGVSNKRARLHTSNFKHLLGEDENGWGLSHNGRLYHNGESWPYCLPFTEYTPVTVGVLVDMHRGELMYFKNGKSLGVAFTDLHGGDGTFLFPTVCSTAAKTVMAIGRRLKSFANLRDRCRHVIASAILHVSCESGQKFKESIHTLPLPKKMKDYLSYYHDGSNNLSCLT